VEDQKAVKAAAALSNVPCVDNLYHETKPRRLLAENLLLIRSWLKSLDKKARICLLGLTLNIIVFHALYTVAS
jgi:hypothetical protein